jgi:hypothetical protein
VADEQTPLPNRPPAERCYTEHVRISPDDEGAYDELLIADAFQKLQRGWRLISITRDSGGDSVELVWDTSGTS